MDILRIIWTSLLGIAFVLTLWAASWIGCAMVDSCWSAL